MGKISAEEWREVFELLDTALELPDAARADWLASLESRSGPVISTLSELLARRTADSFLEQLPQFTISPGLPAPGESAETFEVGSTVGPYRLLSRLGRGGMSSVWAAERIDGMLKRRVAIKLPYVSWAMPEAGRRMTRERDLLASLEHPNIARLYDAGVTSDGRPFLALELVDGQPIDEYCDAHASDIATRVDLALQTARAVAHAHSHSIVHRDLKPSNILVDTAKKVRLLDFGIAKLLDADTPAAGHETQFGGRLFTPDYASPEQVRGETVTASTDIYSLGKVLSRILGTQTRLSRGDLDTIVQKALKDSAVERYPSMTAFADDLERFLRGEPVHARPDSAWYRLRKFATRNQRMLRAVGIAVAGTLAIGIGFGIHQAREHTASTLRAVELSADAIAARSLPRTMPTRDVVAYREYLVARSLMMRPTEEDLREIVRLTESATTRDPKFAQAFALLAGSNVLFLDLGFPRPDALARGESAARRALSLNPQLPGAYATLGSVAAHRGQWIQAEEEFRRAFAIDDQSGRIHARHAKTVLASAGRLDAARQKFQAELRLTPGSARGAMQVATAIGMRPGHEAEALKFVDIALSIGLPADARDVRQLYSLFALRAGRHAEAAEYRTLAMPESMLQAGGRESASLLYEAMKSPAQREKALISIDALARRLTDAGTTSFDSVMFCINGYAMLGDLDRAYAASAQWLQLSASSGLSGIPLNAGFWLHEMRAFRADPRFEALAASMGLVGYWRRFGAPDHCELREKLVCGNNVQPSG